MNQRSPLSMPVGAITPFCRGIHAENSLQVAIDFLAETSLPAVAVVQDSDFVGVLTGQSILQAVSKGHDLTDPVTVALLPDAPTIVASDLGSVGLRKFESSQSPYLVVTDQNGKPHGILTPERLWASDIAENRPPMAGGMATPFGVYLTNGSIRAGVSGWALVATGATMFVFLVMGVLLTETLLSFLPKGTFQPLVLAITQVLPFLVFVLLLRVSGLTGYHGAEHQVVNAIEHGEPIESSVVSRMSRIHPRCGTNFAVAMTMFLSIFSTKWAPDDELRMVIAALVTALFYRPLGSFAQKFLTTTVPSDRQLQAGISAANELITKYQQNPIQETNPLKRLSMSGMLQILVGSFLAFGVVWSLVTVLRIGGPLRGMISF